MTKSKKLGTDAVLKFSEHKRKRAKDLDNDVDGLFKLPLAEFTGARNAMAARLKKSGRGDEAARVKALAKPSISAWAVNQLYWNHREAFDRLIAAGERFHKAQTSRASGKATDMREALDARRAALTQLSDLSTSLLQDAGHNPSLDIVRRVTTTLEGMSAYAQSSDGRYSEGPGRLTHDVDPPGFESFGSFVPGMKSVRSTVGASTSSKRKQTKPTAMLRTLSLPSPKGRGIADGDDDLRRVEETRKAKIAAAKALLQDAKRSLNEARASTQRLEAAQKKADAEANKAEKYRRDLEASLEKAKAASEVAAQRARKVAVDVEEAASEVKDAERSVEATSKELESLIRKSSIR
jgi:hypothetical protein